MDHPLLNEDNLNLRKRVVQLLRNAYSVKRGGDFIFVCGGNKDEDMRIQFRKYCMAIDKDLEIFFPEYAMKDYFSGDIPEPFDIAEFEELVSDLSRAIVLFPEAPGSFAEVGYFAAVDLVARKTLLALDINHQGPDSFISMGPAKKITAKSIFTPNIQIDYGNPNFTDILTRINRVSPQAKLKHLEQRLFSETTNYDLLCFIHKTIDIMSIATPEDIVYILRSLFGHIGEAKILKLLSILVGSGHIKPIGDFGHYYADRNKKNFATIRTGRADEESRVLFELAALYLKQDPEFVTLVEESRNVD